ncbi:hypothetical protein [Paenibacillus sp. y28]|uniref:hypothetical protein n=1 Tax=Paenibacillus sp. y28 TaxID=3129110 RepID=UPI003019D4AF
MRERITPLKVIAIIIFIIGISLVSSYNDVKESAAEMTNSLFDPISNIFEDPASTATFDIEKYQTEAVINSGNYMIEWVSFERNLAVGVSAIVLGLLLFTTASMVDERKFWQTVTKYFTQAGS